MDVTPKYGPLGGAERLRLEEVLDEFREAFNLQFLYLRAAYNEAMTTVEDTDDLLYCHYIEEPGDVDEYWTHIVEVPWWKLHRERQRLYGERRTAIKQLYEGLKHFADLHGSLHEKDLPERLAARYDNWLGFWGRYTKIWIYCLHLPIWNRLHVLARRECYYHRGEWPPESFIQLIEEEETIPQPGENPDEEMWNRRRRLAVRLLLEEDHSFSGVTEFRAVFAQEDEDLGYDPSSVRNYFRNRLDGEDRSTIEKWEQIALRFRAELNTGLDLRETGL
jgi:hypothetical protein